MKLATKIKLIFITVLTFIAVLVAGIAVSTHGTKAVYADRVSTAPLSIELEVVGPTTRASNNMGDVQFDVVLYNVSKKNIGGVQVDIVFDTEVFTFKSATSTIANQHSGWDFESSQPQGTFVRLYSRDTKNNGITDATIAVSTVTFGVKKAPEQKGYTFSMTGDSVPDNIGNEHTVDLPSATFTYREPHHNATIGDISVTGLDYNGNEVTKVLEPDTDGKYYADFLYNTKTTNIVAHGADTDTDKKGNTHYLSTVTRPGNAPLSNVPLDVGENSFTLTVTAEDKTNTQDYELIITRGAASSEHTLSLFELNGEEVTVGDDGVYRATVPFMTDLSTLKAVAYHPYANVVRIGYPVEPEEGDNGNGGDVAPVALVGDAGKNETMLLKAGENELHVSVKAEDEVVYPVTVIITRELPDLTSVLTWLRFNGAYVESAPDADGKYTIEVPFTTRTAKMNAEADTEAHITHMYAEVIGVVVSDPVEDDTPDIDRPVNNGINATFDLVQGDNLFYVVVRYKGENNLDDDGWNYNVNVLVKREYASGDKVLEYLKVNDNEIIPGADGKYNLGDIPYSTYFIKVEAAAIDLAYVSKISLGTLSVSGDTVEKLTLLPGENVIKIEVTAQDGTTQEHELILRRQEANHEYVKIEFDFTDKQMSKFDETPNFFIGEDDIAEDNGEPIVRTIKAPKKYIDFSLTVPESVSVDVLFFFSQSYETVTGSGTSDSGSVSPLAKVIKPTVSDDNLNYHIEKLDGGSNTLLLRISDSLSGMSKLCIIDIERPVKGGVSPAAIVFLVIFLINMLVIAVLFILDSRNKVEVDETTYKIIVENGGTAPVIIDPSYVPTSSGKDEKKKGKKKGKEDDIELEGANDNKSKDVADKIKMLNKVKQAKESEKEAEKAEEASGNDIQSKLDALKKKKAAEESAEAAPAEEPKKEKKSLFGRKKETAAEATKSDDINSKLDALKKKKAAEEPVEAAPAEEPKKEKKSLFGKKKTEEAPAPAEEPKKELTPQEKAALLSKKKAPEKADSTKDEEINSKLNALKKKAPAEEPKKAPEKADSTKDEEINSKLNALKKKAPAEEPKKAPEKAAPAEEPKKASSGKSKKTSQTDQLLTEIRDLLATQNNTDNNKGKGKKK